MGKGDVMIKLAVLLMWTPIAYAANPWIEGAVTEVFDGDTIKVRLDAKIPRFGFRWPEFGEDPEEIQNIRLSQIDAPELKQPYGRDARQFVAQNILGKKVRIIEEGSVGTPGLTQAKVWFLANPDSDERNRKWVEVNGLLVSTGLAWVGQYSANEELKVIEQEAQKQKRGLFKESDPLPPWIYREKLQAVKHKVFSRRQCLNSKSCRQMGSCSEAIAYLQNCARFELDPNGDGIPCETTVCNNQVKLERTFNQENDD